MDYFQRKLAAALVILLGNLASVATLNALLALLLENLHRIRRSKLLSIIDNSSRRFSVIANKIHKRRRGVRRFWKRPGRTDAWWGNFVKNIVVPEQWKENFRMSRESFFDLCNELRPFLQQQQTNMRAPISVEKQVAVALYYLSDE